jgi:hypothetical protein
LVPAVIIKLTRNREGEIGEGVFLEEERLKREGLMGFLSIT